jgi:formylglycine-generating enzyme required for sulfatase activity
MLSSRLKRPLLIMLGVLFIILSYGVWFVFTAKQMVFQIDPTPDKVSLKGGLLKMRFGSYYLLRPGDYLLNASKQGYHTVKHPFEVTKEKNQKISITMKKLPGRLTLTAHDQDQPSLPIEGAMVFIDGTKIGTTPLSQVEVEAGSRHLLIKADLYQEFKTPLEIEGMDTLQTLEVALIPGWTEIRVETLPTGARIFVDGTPRGETPLSLKLSVGTHELKISAENYKTWTKQLLVQRNQPQMLDTIHLQPADGTLTLKTTPSGANVTVGGTFIGQTPVDIPLQPDVKHKLLISKAGYNKIERTVQVATAGTEEISLALVPRKGVVHFNITPQDADLFINEKSLGVVPKSLELTAVPQKIKITKTGYESYFTELIPRPGFPQEVTATLQLKNAPKKTSRGTIKAANAYPLVLINPSSYRMGSSRREQGRRSNETLRNIVLKRPFYMGVREVTNGEFRAFLASHDSGSFKGYSLNRDEQPVVQVTWEQAAQFCNWLSEKEKLPTVYIKKGDKLLAQEPLLTGYRLPTEAEWEYSARFANNKASLLYPWGDTFPPTSKTLNIADLSTKDLLPTFLGKYDDDYSVTSPVASFNANALGLFDLGGNVAEWCHDYYSIYSYSPSALYQDPTGTEQGKHHLVRGSSWRQSSISVLRCAYRDYSDDKRNDLGFRICRYAQ